MRKFSLTVLLTIVWVLFSFTQEKSQTIVYINGTKYYIHSVEKGETLYSLGKLYGVDQQMILKHNPAVAASGLKLKETVKIPVVESRKEKLSRKKIRKTFTTHIVKAGETLYAISRHYEIPIPTLMKDNPDLDPIRLKLDQQILVRKKKIGTESEADSDADWKRYHEQLNDVKDDSVYYHLVKKGETFYSISHQYGISEQELSAMNDNLLPENLKAGVMLRIAGEKNGEGEVVVPAKDRDSLRHQETVPQVDFRALGAEETLKVALLLPISVEGKTNSNYLELYQGFLLGLDSVKVNHGYSVDVTLYNTDRDPKQIEEILSSKSFEDTQLIIGPVYESGLYPVIRHAEEHAVPVVSPLAHMQTDSDVLFQMAPVEDAKYDKVRDMLDRDKSVTLIYTDKTDKEFEREMLNLLGEYPYKTFRYKYSRDDDSSIGSLIHNQSDNVFIVMSSDEVEVDRIMASLTSAYANLTARGFQIPPYKVLGNARWNRFNNMDRTTWFKNNTTFVSTYHAKRDNEAIINFDKAYMKSFGTLPTLYSYRGFDAAMIFVLGMYNDIEYDMAGKRYTPLRSTYMFKQGEHSSKHANYNWTRVNYNHDFTVTIQ